MIWGAEKKRSVKAIESLRFASGDEDLAGDRFLLTRHRLTMRTRGNTLQETG
jgi:hypothetical protein